LEHVAQRIGLTLLCIGTLGGLSCAYAEDSVLHAPRATLRLPDLHTVDNTRRGSFQLDGHRAAVGYGARSRKWDARLDGYLNGNPSLSIDYGTLLGERFGAGMTLIRRDDYSEVLVNGVYAPDRNIRLQMTRGQLRSASDPFGAVEAGDVLQNSYLLGIRRHWDERLLSPDLGIAAYTVEASGNGDGAGEANTGTLDGYMLNLSLQPTPRSRIEWRHDLGRLTQQFDQHARNERVATANRIGYEHTFANCIRLRGGVSTSARSRRLELRLARKNWNVGIAQSHDGAARDMSAQVAYRIPLGGRRGHAHSCSGRLENLRPFEPIVNAAVKRPHQLPQVPITEGDSAISSGALAP
jgi:hypothetical protein